MLSSERRPLKGFMKMYKTPPQRRRKKNDEGDMASEGEEREGEAPNHVSFTKDAQTNNVSADG